MIRNKFISCFILIFLGFLSLSFLGIENKSVRVVSLLFVSMIAVSHVGRIKSIIAREPILKSWFLFFLFSIPSIFFCREITKCGFKLFDLCMMVMITALGVIYFKTRKSDVFKYICWYYVFQTVVTIIGYFVDPKAIAADIDYGNYVTFLHCNYPPIHGNSIGEFGGVTLLFTLVLIHFRQKARQLNFRSRIYFFVIGLFGLSVLYLSSSRTCMIAFVVAFIFLFLHLYNPKTKLKFTMVGLCLALLFSNQIINTTVRILMKKQNEQTMAAYVSTEDALMSGRLSIWENVMNHSEQLIIGKGYGVASSENEIGAANAHNSIMEILINSGVFALFFWIRMWFLMYRCYRWLCKNQEYLPVDISWIHLGAAFAVQSVIRSFGNVSFVYFHLNVFSVIGTIILFSYCRSSVIENKIMQLKLKMKTDAY